MKSTLKLPKPYLSYSAISLWCRDKEAFRARYYRGEKLFETPYMLFGREVHDLLENDKGLQHIPRYPLKELKLETIVEGVPVMGYVDCMDDTYERPFIDYKSSIRNKDGSSKWNDLEVFKLDQLPFYSMLIHENYLDVPELHHSQLIWLETQWKQVDQQLGSQTLTGDGNELELTGHHEVFERTIEPWERERIKTLIVKSASEISEDYKEYLATTE